MRKYTAIWLRLKEDKHCVITTHVALHPRIIKAISCEKNKDVGYKLLLAEVNRKVILGHVVTGSRIRFFIQEYLLGDMSVDDL